jgi:hypothetical protein
LGTGSGKARGGTGSLPRLIGIPPAGRHGQDPDGSGQVGHAATGALTLEASGATNNRDEIGEAWRSHGRVARRDGVYGET